MILLEVKYDEIKNTLFGDKKIRDLLVKKFSVDKTSLPYKTVITLRKIGLQDASFNIFNKKKENLFNETKKVIENEYKKLLNLNESQLLILSNAIKNTIKTLIETKYFSHLKIKKYHLNILKYSSQTESIKLECNSELSNIDYLKASFEFKNYIQFEDYLEKIKDSKILEILNSFKYDHKFQDLILESKCCKFESHEDVAKFLKNLKKEIFDRNIKSILEKTPKESLKFYAGLPIPSEYKVIPNIQNPKIVENIQLDEFVLALYNNQFTNINYEDFGKFLAREYEILKKDVKYADNDYLENLFITIVKKTPNGLFEQLQMPIKEYLDFIYKIFLVKPSCTFDSKIFSGLKSENLFENYLNSQKFQFCIVWLYYWNDGKMIDKFVGSFQKTKLDFFNIALKEDLFADLQIELVKKLDILFSDSLLQHKGTLFYKKYFEFYFLHEFNHKYAQNFMENYVKIYESIEKDFFVESYPKIIKQELKNISKDFQDKIINARATLIKKYIGDLKMKQIVEILSTFNNHELLADNIVIVKLIKIMIGYNNLLKNFYKETENFYDEHVREWANYKLINWRVPLEIKNLYELYGKFKTSFNNSEEYVLRVLTDFINCEFKKFIKNVNEMIKESKIDMIGTGLENFDLRSNLYDLRSLYCNFFERPRFRDLWNNLTKMNSEYFQELFKLDESIADVGFYRVVGRFQINNNIFFTGFQSVEYLVARTQLLIESLPTLKLNDHMPPLESTSILGLLLKSDDELVLLDYIMNLDSPEHLKRFFRVESLGNFEKYRNSINDIVNDFFATDFGKVIKELYLIEQSTPSIQSAERLIRVYSEYQKFHCLRSLKCIQKLMFKIVDNTSNGVVDDLSGQDIETYFEIISSIFTKDSQNIFTKKYFGTKNYENCFKLFLQNTSLDSKNRLSFCIVWLNLASNEKMFDEFVRFVKTLKEENKDFDFFEIAVVDDRFDEIQMKLIEKLQVGFSKYLFESYNNSSLFQKYLEFSLSQPVTVEYAENLTKNFHFGYLSGQIVQKFFDKIIERSLECFNLCKDDNFLEKIYSYIRNYLDILEPSKIYNILTLCENNFKPICHNHCYSDLMYYKLINEYQNKSQFNLIKKFYFATNQKISDQHFGKWIKNKFKGVENNFSGFAVGIYPLYQDFLNVLKSEEIVYQVFSLLMKEEFKLFVSKDKNLVNSKATNIKELKSWFDKEYRNILNVEEFQELWNNIKSSCSNHFQSVFKLDESIDDVKFFKILGKLVVENNIHLSGYQNVRYLKARIELLIDGFKKFNIVAKQYENINIPIEIYSNIYSNAVSSDDEYILLDFIKTIHSNKVSDQEEYLKKFFVVDQLTISLDDEFKKKIKEFFESTVGKLVLKINS